MKDEQELSHFVTGKKSGKDRYQESSVYRPGEEKGGKWERKNSKQRSMWFDIGKGESEEETKKQGVENKWKRVVVRCRTTDRRKGEEPKEKISGIDRAWKRY